MSKVLTARSLRGVLTGRCWGRGASERGTLGAQLPQRVPHGLQGGGEVTPPHPPPQARPVFSSALSAREMVPPRSQGNHLKLKLVFLKWLGESVKPRKERVSKRERPSAAVQRGLGHRAPGSCNNPPRPYCARRWAPTYKSPHLRDKETRPREVKELTEGHPAAQRCRGSLNLDFSPFQS